MVGKIVPDQKIVPEVDADVTPTAKYEAVAVEVEVRRGNVMADTGIAEPVDVETTHPLVERVTATLL